MRSELGTAIASWRQAKGWQQKELAARLGLSAQMVNDLERGRREPSPATLDQLARVLDVPRATVYMLARRIPAELQDNERFLSELGELLARHLGEAPDARNG